MKHIKHCFSYKHCEMKNLFHVTSITKLLQLSMLLHFDFQGLKKNNVGEVII